MKITKITKENQKLKILLLTDRLSLGGAETHLISLYNSLVARGHFVTVVSSGGELSKNVRHVSIDLSSHSPIKLIFGYFALRSLVLKEKFNLIHAHARLPALIASLISKEFKIPLLNTAHARFKTNGLRLSLSKWGFRTVAVSEDLRFYLSEKYSVPCENITVIENGINFEAYSKRAPKSKAQTILFLSRLDCDCSLCAELLCDIAPRLVTRYGDIKILIGGGGECFEDIKNMADRINSSIGSETVSVVGEISAVSDFLLLGDVFVGVSRCALEAIATSLPAVIAGNEGFLGKLTPNNFSVALASNFCARGKAKPDSNKLFDAICSVMDDYENSQIEARSICNKARKMLDMSVIAPQYEDFYYKSLERYSRSQKKNAKTLLFGYYGFSNLGDDALFRVAIERAISEFGDSVGALTNQPKISAQRFAVPCYSRTSPFSLFYRILRCERLIFGGGTLFQDGTSRRSLLYYIFVLRLALFLKKDVILYANGIGEIREGMLRNTLFKLLSRCSYIGVRDKRSFKLLQKVLGASAPIVLEDDLALSLPFAPLSRARFLIDNALKSSSASFFAVCPHFKATHFDRFELELAIRKYKNMGMKPLFIACSPDDLDIVHDLKLKFGGGMLSSLSFSDLLSLFSSAECVISMRYHPLLAARVSSVPTLPIGFDPKIAEFKV